MKAFSLVETVVIVAITTMAMLAITTLVLLTSALLYDQHATIATAGSTAALVREVGLSVESASAVMPSHTFGSATYTSTTSTLVLKLPAINSGGAVIAGASDYVAFVSSNSSSTVYRIVAAAPGSSRASGTKLLSSAVEALTYTYDAPSLANVTSVTVDLTTRLLVKEQVFSAREREQVYLRNK